jgi:hypothetical protein
MSYREVYKSYYDIEFDDDYEIHHIDLNHKNDDIKNLMLLPKEIHQKYHLALSELPIENGSINIITQIKSVVEQGNGFNSYMLAAVERFVNIYSECQKWLDYKCYLDGLISNIHNISIKGCEKI